MSRHDFFETFVTHIQMILEKCKHSPNTPSTNCRTTDNSNKPRYSALGRRTTTEQKRENTSVQRQSSQRTDTGKWSAPRSIASTSSSSTAGVVVVGVAVRSRVARRQTTTKRAMLPTLRGVTRAELVHALCLFVVRCGYIIHTHTTLLYI